MHFYITTIYYFMGVLQVSREVRSKNSESIEEKQQRRDTCGYRHAVCSDVCK